MSLELSRLEKLRNHGGKFIARCPACAETGNDTSAEHLFINSDGKFGCVNYQSTDGAEHRKRIFELVGIEESKPTGEKSIWTALRFAPDNAPSPTLNHHELGMPSAHWTYHTAEGKIAGIIARYTTAKGKETRPQSWCKDQHGNTAWRWKSMLEPRPLYGLPMDHAECVIVEGEKCADAVKAAGLNAVTWSGGSGAVSKTNWQTLAGKSATIWPDNDEPGRKALAEILRKLQPIARKIKIVQIPEGRPVGWDAADTDSFEIHQLVAGAKLYAPEVKKSTECENIPPAEKFFYDGNRYYLDTQREFVPMDQRSVSRHLKSWGQSREEIDGVLCDIQTDRHIHFAGPLAGHPRGIHNSGGTKLLATVSPEIVEPAAGSWPTLRAVLDGLLDDPDAGKVQVDTFLAWLKVARESLVSNRRRPGQAIAFAGPRGSGKSLLIDITEAALGGRRANPYPYFTGRTNFNADLAGAELLAVDDEAGSTDIRSRRTLAANIKSCLFAGAVRIEGKGKTAFTFRPCWRMMVALNDEPEALLVLPPITEDIGDKITLFRCHKRPLPMPAHTLEEKDAFFSKLREELPAMLAELEVWSIPETLAEERCGVRAFHHPAILAALHELSPEGHLLNIIDTAEAAGVIQLPWTGTASELKAILLHNTTVARDAEKLIGGYVNTCGTYLGRLEGDRVQKVTVKDGFQVWRIFPSGPVEQVSTLNDESEKGDWK